MLQFRFSACLAIKNIDNHLQINVMKTKSKQE